MNFQKSITSLASVPVAPQPYSDKQETKKEPAVETKVLAGIEELSGVGEKTQAALKEADFSSVEDIANANPEDLTKVKGVGEKKAQSLIKEAKKLFSKASKA